LLQLVAVVLYLGLAPRAAQLSEFMQLFVLATLVTIVVSGFLPAAGAWKHYGCGASFDLGAMSHFEALRSGAMREIPLGRMQGLISLPSLHSAMAVLIAYAMRGTLLRWPAVVLDAAMLVSTPLEGGHYFVDVLAGIGLALGLIAVQRRRARADGAVLITSTGRDIAAAQPAR
jgi:membrane-associated phospholipid phosphatase